MRLLHCRLMNPSIAFCHRPLRRPPRAATPWKHRAPRRPSHLLWPNASLRPGPSLLGPCSWAGMLCLSAKGSSLQPRPQLLHWMSRIPPSCKLCSTLTKLLSWIGGMCTCFLDHASDREVLPLPVARSVMPTTSSVAQPCPLQLLHRYFMITSCARP